MWLSTVIQNHGLSVPKTTEGTQYVNLIFGVKVMFVLYAHDPDPLTLRVNVAHVCGPGWWLHLAQIRKYLVCFKLNCGFELLMGQNKQFKDFTSELPEKVIGIFHNCLTFYWPDN